MFSPKIGLSTMAKKQRQISPLTWEKKSGSDVVATRTALPLRLSYALTIHKSQGQTLPRVEISFTNGSFANGQAYSALSRATGFRGLTIKKLKESDIKVAKKVIDWYMMVFGTVS
jgi:ATP-dependent exoDNAse (exonuclease V) alpha subunit|tara:strand:+ start:103 stop:447 length:345 start_codon:yes stop_codon:yes gene_type:complete